MYYIFYHVEPGALLLSIVGTLALPLTLTPALAILKQAKKRYNNAEMQYRLDGLKAQRGE